MNWLLAVATFLSSLGAVATLIGVFVNRQQNRQANAATTVAQVMDGLKTIADERAVDLVAARARIAELEAELARRKR